MSRIKLILLALFVAAFSMGMIACGDDDEGDSGGDSGGGGETALEMTIGVSLPLSGDLADFGPAGEKAADLALAQIQSAVEEAGVDHTVTLAKEDNCGAADPQCAVQAQRKLVTDGASCIAGPWGSADTIPSGESVSVPEEVPLISPSATSDEITGLDDDGFVNRTSPPDSFQGPTLANLLDEELGGAEGKTVNIGARNDAYGTGLAGTFSAAWEGLGGSIGEEVIYDIDLPNYDTEAEQITSGSPDATVIIDFPETYNKVGPALVRTGNFDPANTFVTDGLITDLADAGEEAANGLRGTAPGAPDDAEASVAFDEAYKAAEPTDVDRLTFDAQNFDAVILCYLAAVAAGSSEGADIAETLQGVSGPEGDEYTWEELPAAIEALQNGDDIGYTGAAGPIDLDDAGDATAGVYDVYEFKGTAPEPVDEVEVAAPGS